MAAAHQLSQHQRPPLIAMVGGDAASVSVLIEKVQARHYRARGFRTAKQFLDALDYLDAVDCLVLDDSGIESAGGGLELLQSLLERQLDIPVIMLVDGRKITAVIHAMKAGVTDCLLKPVGDLELFDTLASVLQARRLRNFGPSNADVVRGIVELTDRQRQILVLVGDGLTNKQIAIQLDISFRTVEVHRANILKALAAKSTADLIRISISNRANLARARHPKV